ncbi:unnamed protein product, partial [Ixodes pacificus]
GAKGYSGSSRGAFAATKRAGATASPGRSREKLIDPLGRRVPWVSLPNGTGSLRLNKMPGTASRARASRYATDHIYESFRMRNVKVVEKALFVKCFQVFYIYLCVR